MLFTVRFAFSVLVRLHRLESQYSALHRELLWLLLRSSLCVHDCLVKICNTYFKHIFPFCYSFCFTRCFMFHLKHFLLWMLLLYIRKIILGDYVGNQIFGGIGPAIWKVFDYLSTRITNSPLFPYWNVRSCCYEKFSSVFCCWCSIKGKPAPAW